MPPSIRVWLEPGWDRGRTAAWMLDLPGCFTWGETRETALAHVPSAVGAFAAWHEEHGEPVEVPQTDAIDIVEEVATPAVADDAREAQAIFEADRAAVSAAGLEAAVRGLEHSHTDLARLARTVLDWEAEHGPLPVRRWIGARGRLRTDQSTEEVLRHVGWADILLGGRLDGARFSGRPSKDRLEFIAATNAWLIERLRALHAAGAAAAGDVAEVTDSAGERWTLAKVVRRAIAHRLDHLGELDRRLARAQGAVDALAVRNDVLVDPDRLTALFRAVGWYRRVADRGRLARMLEGSTQMVSAWEGELMVGFARAIHDDAFNGYIGSVAVHPRWQGKGLGRRLIRELVETNDQIRFVLTAVPGLEPFYESLGFRRQAHAMSRERLR